MNQSVDNQAGGYEPEQEATHSLYDERAVKEFWVMFLKDPSTGKIHGTASGHQSVADYRNNPYFVGWKKIEVNLGRLGK